MIVWQSFYKRELFTESQRKNLLPGQKEHHMALAASILARWKELIGQAERVLKAPIAKGDITASGATTSAEENKLIKDTLAEMNRFEATLQIADVAQALHAYVPTREREPLDSKFLTLKNALVKTLNTRM